MKKRMLWNYLNYISNFALWLCGVCIIPFCGLFVYTPEFYKKVKVYLEGNFEFSISRFLFYLIIIFLIIGICAVLKLISEKILENESKINELNEKNSELNFKLSQCTNNKLNVDKTQKIQQAMERFVINNNDVISVQIYECKESKCKNSITYDISLAEFKYVRDGASVNDIQECYKVDQRKLKKYHEVKRAYIDNNNEKEYTKYLRDLTNRLQKKEKKPISDSIIFDYCCLTLSYQYYFGENPFEIKDIDKNFQEKINEIKRNGFLRGIIEKDFNKFRHSGKSKKNNRIDITKCLPIESIPHMFVITLSPSVIKRDDYSVFIDDIGDKFYSILEDDLGIVYNNYKVG